METSESIWDNFINKYSLEKTLRFELKPIGNTLQTIKEKGFIKEDKKREENFNKVKEIMDDYYKDFIEKCLSGIEIENLKDHEEIYKKLKQNYKDKYLKKEYSESEKRIRKSIYEQITKKDNFDKIFKEEFLKQILPDWLEKKGKEQEKELVLSFSKWVTYFTKFFSNRKNVFSEDEIPTSIIYRIVNDNLPKFLYDKSKFEELKDMGFDYSEIEKNFKNELNGKNLEEFFSLDNFKNCINQSGIDRFNLIIGGRSEADNVKIKGLNEIINEFAQKNKNSESDIRKLKLVPLFKQILSDSESPSFILERINNKKEMFEKIQNFYSSFNDISDKLISTIKNLNKFDVNQIYLKNDSYLNEISKNIFGDYDIIKEGLKLYFDDKSKNKKESEKAQKSEFIPISYINEGIKKLELELNDNSSIVDYFSNLSEQPSNSDNNLIEAVKNKYKCLEPLKENIDNINQISEEGIVKIKNFLDSAMSLYHFLKPLYLNSNKNRSNELELLDIDLDFYNEFNKEFEELEKIVPLYNQVRNYITRKFITKKFKLNFDKSTLANGWDLNKEKDNLAVILRKRNPVTKKYDYYLGIMIKESTKIFKGIPEGRSVNKENSYEKMIYKFIPSPNKNLPRVFLSSKKGKDKFKPSNEIVKIYEEKSYIKDSEEKDKDKKKFNTKDLHKMIDFYKDCLKNYKKWSKYFNFNFKDTNEYHDISEFYTDVEQQGYKISWKYYDEEYVNNLIQEGKLLMFQIWNKDFSGYSKGKQNLHTIYWNLLFSEENINGLIKTYKLNGNAELFYREKSIEREITHSKNNPIKNKNPINEKKESVFKYDLIKDKRYTEDKFFFHCPITLNYGTKHNEPISKTVNKIIQDSQSNINILGIDRGERNLLYYSLIDLNGKIIKQGSLNTISDDKKRELDYHSKLDQIEGRRDEARKNWKDIDNIKNMKEGYLSQVIHQIAKLAVEYNAIITLEDLNFGFKTSRFKIEKQVYQKFEKMLIDKFNYLAFKDRNEKEPGGMLKAYQLTDEFKSFKNLGKQSGIIYYVNAGYTSKICPKTGFVDMLRPKFENVKKSKEFFSKFKYIKYKKDEDLFEFNFEYSKFIVDKNKNPKLKRDNWSIWSNGIKLDTKRDNNGYWRTEKINVTEELKKLFNANEIDYTSENNLIEKIKESNDKNFHFSLIYLLRLILRLRNSYIDYEVEEIRKKNENKFNIRDYDYILSCVKDNNGEFFDSRKSSGNEVLDADANGAYHIALKGLMLIEKIKKIKDYDASKKIDLRINNNEFINYVIERSGYGGEHNNL